jgi:hypothetical protein
MLKVMKKEIVPITNQSSLQILETEALRELMFTLKGGFLYFSVVVICLIGVPQRQIMQALEMMITILATAAWKEPMFVRIQAKDPSEILLFINLFTGLLPWDCWYKLGNGIPLEARNKTIVTASLTMTSKEIAVLNDVFDNFMDGIVGFLGILPDTHPASTSYATITIDLNVDTSKEFDRLCSYIEGTCGFPLKKLLDQHIPTAESKKILETYKRICNSIKLHETINVNDEPFLTKVETLMEDFQAQNTMRTLLRNVARFNNASVDIKNLTVIYHSANATEVPSLTATDEDYAIFYSMIKKTLKVWEENTLEFTEAEILIIKILEPSALRVIEDQQRYDWGRQIPPSTRRKADIMASATNEDNFVFYYRFLEDESQIAAKLNKLGYKINLDERQKCYKKLKNRGILGIKQYKYRSAVTGLRYFLLRFDLLKDTKFHDVAFDETLMLGAGEQIASLPLQASDSEKQNSITETRA